MEIGKSSKLRILPKHANCIFLISIHIKWTTFYSRQMTQQQVSQFMQKSYCNIWSTSPRLCKHKQNEGSKSFNILERIKNHRIVCCRLEKIVVLLSSQLLLWAGRLPTHTSRHYFWQNPSTWTTPALPANPHIRLAFWGGRWAEKKTNKEYISSTQNNRGSNKNE
jgi:hypothetical protein